MFASEIIMMWMSHVAGSDNIFPPAPEGRESDLNNEKYLYSKDTGPLFSTVIPK